MRHNEDEPRVLRQSHAPRSCATRLRTDTAASWDADDGDGSSYFDSSGFNSDWEQLGQWMRFFAALTGLTGVWLTYECFEGREKHRAADSLPGATTHLTRRLESPREGWEAKVAASGLTFAMLPGVCWASEAAATLLGLTWLRRLGLEQSYWNEHASYELSDEGAWRIESASFELHSMMLEAVDEVIRSDVLLDEFGIPAELWPAVRSSWHARSTDFIGRLDLLWDGEGEPKLAEYNADTPTVLIEAAAAQRDWCAEVHPTKGQFNVLDEALEAGKRAPDPNLSPLVCRA